MTRGSSARYKEVQGLSRGLEVLRTLNTSRGGELSIMDVATRTGLHRTTVRRLLETLLANGYLRRSPSDDTFRLALRVCALSEGFTDDDWISQAGSSELHELLRQAVWPSDLCTFAGDGMVIRETTHRFSPLSVHQGMVGVRLPMLFTATGRAYLASCSDAERDEAICQLSAGKGAQAELARSPKAISALLEKTRSVGYGWNFREWAEKPNVAAIAVPVVHDSRVFGVVNMVYQAGAVTMPQAVERYLGPLQATAARIERFLAGSRS